MFCHGTNVCHRKPYVLLYTIANQQHARNQVLLQGSCGEVAGTRDLMVRLVSKFRTSGAGQGAGTRAPFPCISQDREGCYGPPMVLMVFPSMSAVAPPKGPGLPKSLCVLQPYANLWHCMSCGIWHHVSPWELPHQVELRGSCGNVAGTGYLAPSPWLFQARILGVRRQALRASSARPTTVQKPWFFCCGNKFSLQNHVFSVAGAKRASGNSSKTMVFLLREEMGVLKTTKGMTFLAKSSCGVQGFFFSCGS